VGETGRAPLWLLWLAVAERGVERETAGDMGEAEVAPRSKLKVLTVFAIELRSTVLIEIACFRWFLVGSGSATAPEAKKLE